MATLHDKFRVDFEHLVVRPKTFLEIDASEIFYRRFGNPLSD